TWEGRAAVYEGEPLAALLGIPLKWQSRVLGVLNLNRNENSPRFTPDDLRLANLFAAQAAAALENARLLAALESQLASQHVLTDFSRTLLENTDADAIL